MAEDAAKGEMWMTVPWCNVAEFTTLLLDTINKLARSERLLGELKTRKRGRCQGVLPRNARGESGIVPALRVYTQGDHLWPAMY